MRSGEEIGRGRSAWFVRLADRFCVAPTDVETPEERRRARTVVAFALLGSFVIAAFALLNLKHGNLVAAAIQLVCVAGSVALLLLAMPRGLVQLTAHYAISASILSIAFGIWYGGGIESAAMVFLPVIPVFGMLSIGVRGGISGTVHALAVVLVVVMLEKLGFEPRHDPPDKLYVKRVFETLAVILQLSFLALIFHNLKERAQRALARNLDELGGLLDGMRQGVLAFDAHGKVVGRHSRQALEIFGLSRLHGASVVDLLYPPEIHAEDRLLLEQFIEAAFAIPPEEWPALLELAPTRAVRHLGEPDEQHLSFEFRPLFERGKLARIMLLVADETEPLRLKRAAEEQRKSSEKAMLKLRRLRADGAHVMVELLETAERRLGELETSLAAHVAGMPMAEIERLFRIAHTLKGEARVFDFEVLADVLHRVEDELARFRDEARNLGHPITPSPEAVSALLADAKREVLKARAELVAASPAGAAVLDQVPVRRADLAQLERYVERFGADAQLRAIAANLVARPFGECTRELFDAVERWCVSAGKRALLTVHGRAEMVPPRLQTILPGCLSHLVRNAVAHGIEPASERVARGKDPVGSIVIVCEQGAIRVEDDGRGIDCDALRAKKGLLQLDDPSALGLVFEEGLSTADDVDALRGRGVGMGAVRADLTARGYGIRVTSERGKGTCFELFAEASALSGRPAAE